MRFILHVFVGNVEVKSIGLVHGRSGVLLSDLWSLLSSCGGSVSSLVVWEARLTFTVLVLGHSKCLILWIVT